MNIYFFVAYVNFHFAIAKTNYLLYNDIDIIFILE